MSQETKVKALLYTDGSETASAALRFLRSVLPPPTLEAHLLAVAERPAAVAEAEQVLQDGQQMLAESGVPATLHSRLGPTPDELLREIDDGDYGLFVLGSPDKPTNALPGIPEPVNSLVDSMPISYLVVRGRRPRLSKVLACTGGYKYGEEVIRMAARLARASGAEVTILYVGEVPPLMYTGLQEMEEPLPALLKTHTREAHYLKRGARILVENQVAGEIKFTRGIVAQEIFRVAREGDYDLIAVGASRAGRSPFRQILLGNITRTVLEHARRPVLVVRSRPERRPQRILNRIRFMRRHP